MTANIDHFISRWLTSGAAERANYQLFLSELCDVLDVPRPDPTTPDESANAYVFEKPVPLPPGAPGRIDLYRRGCFVLEAKQGSDAVNPGAVPALSAEGQARHAKRKRGTALRGTASWDTAMERARQQAQSYARNLPNEELKEGGRPPFLIVVDVGESLTLYSEFTRTGGNYILFPDPQASRITLASLADPTVREQLQNVWLDPMSLDPSRRSARVTREIADRLAKLAKALEGAGYGADPVAHFLMRCLFTMFAEDVGLLPGRSFTQLLADARRDPAHFPHLAEELWAKMASGGFSYVLRKEIRHFNGRLFENASALALTEDQLQLLIEAAQSDWRDVEPAIFGTLLEHALDTVERHQLGAHFTPRAYVERLVGPTVVEPLRAEWDAVQATALRLTEEGKPDRALGEVEAFQKRLASVRILDPACGTGNFLYVSLEHLLRLESEVLQRRSELGAGQMLLQMEDVRVTPRQLLGIEINPRAAAIAELVLWIGFLRWRLQTAGDVGHLPEPLLANYHNIERRDAVLDWDRTEPLLDKDGQPVTRWDGRTTKRHPVTGEQVPDETARVEAMRYINPRPAEWPQADFVVGNPPFIGNKRMRAALGDGYVDALRATYQLSVPTTADYVMYWWSSAAKLVQVEAVRRFGFITTNSITQVFNRSVVAPFLDANPPLSIVFAVPDHPWVDTEEGAAVRIAMTVARAGDEEGALASVVAETEGKDGVALVGLERRQGRINADLTLGVRLDEAKALIANRWLASQGANPLGLGFRLSREKVSQYGFDLGALPPVLRSYSIGKDLVQRPEEKYVIDFFGMSEEHARAKYPGLYQHILVHVKPERDQNRRDVRRINWWLFGENAPMLRAASQDLSRYIATCRTAKHRVFVFLGAKTIPDAKIVAIALEDAHWLGVLSSRIHVLWATRTGAWLGVGNDSNYNHSDCFGRFPFPDATDAQKARIRDLAEELDAHRKRQQALHPKLTLTDMYNVLEKLRAGAALTPAEKVTHEHGLVSVLRQLHDEIDAAVFEAYGWPSTLTDEEILTRLVALNAERAAEEARGVVRWLRPEYQAPAASAVQVTIEAEEEGEAPAVAAPVALRPWPVSLPDQAAAVRGALTALARPATVEEVAAAFTDAPKERVGEWLAALAALGQARPGQEGTWLAG